MFQRLHEIGETALLNKDVNIRKVGYVALAKTSKPASNTDGFARSKIISNFELFLTNTLLIYPELVENTVEPGGQILKRLVDRFQIN